MPVWIYGGGYTTGSATLDVYRPERYVERGVVFVAMQYRVNVFGFLYLGEGSGAPGNAGLMDQASEFGNWFSLYYYYLMCGNCRLWLFSGCRSTSPRSAATPGQ